MWWRCLKFEVSVFSSALKYSHLRQHCYSHSTLLWSFSLYVLFCFCPWICVRTLTLKVKYRRFYLAMYVSLSRLNIVTFMTLFLWFIAETLVKTIGGEPDVTPICTNSTYNIITLIICKIRTERSKEQCSLLYQYGWDFMQNFDSRFTLAAENQTVFLHLTGLTPVDSGSYTCECSHPDGTFILNLNITVEGTCLIHFHPFLTYIYL